METAMPHSTTENCTPRCGTPFAAAPDSSTPGSSTPGSSTPDSSTRGRTTMGKAPQATVRAQRPAPGSARPKGGSLVKKNDSGPYPTKVNEPRPSRRLPGAMPAPIIRPVEVLVGVRAIASFLGISRDKARLLHVEGAPVTRDASGIQRSEKAELWAWWRHTRES